MASFLTATQPVPVFWAQLAILDAQWSDVIPPCVVVPAQATATPAVTDWCILGKSWLLSQFVGKPKLEALLCIFLSQTQNVEQLFADLEQLRALDTAFGVQLDNLGILLGLGRATWETDEDYRLALSAWGKATIANGTPDDLLGVAVEYLSGRSTVSLNEYFPLSLRVDVASDVLTYDQGHRAAQIVREAVPVTVDYAFRYAPVGLPIVTWDDDTLHPPVALAEDGVPGSGGVFAEADPGGNLL